MSIVFVQPKAEETVVDTVNALFVRDEILSQQSLDCCLYGTRSGQAVLFDEFRGLNGAGIALLIDGDEHLFLPFRKPEQNLPESIFVGIEYVTESLPDHAGDAFAALRRQAEKHVEHLLNVPGDPVEAGIDLVYHTRGDTFALLPEMSLGESLVFGQSDRFKVHHRNALVERTRRTGEHIAHDVPLASGEHEAGVRTVLDMGPQEGFHVLLRIRGDLLELVDGYENPTVGLFEVAEYLVERRFLCVDVAQLQVEAGIARRVERDTGLQGFHAVPECFERFAARRFQSV